MAEGASRPARHRWRRRLLRIAGILAVVIAGLLLFAAFALPVIVERIVVRALADAGFSGASVRVNGIGLRHADLSDLRLDTEGRAGVAAVAATYSPWTLLGGRVSTVTVTGAELRLRVREGRLDLGPLDRLKGGNGGGSGSIEMPFDRLDLRASALVIDFDGREVRVPVEGSIGPLQDGRRSVHLRADALAAPVTATGTLAESEGTVAFDVSVDDLSLASLAAALPGAFRGPVAASGTVDVGLKAQLGPAGGQADLTVTARDLRADVPERAAPVTAQLVTCTAHATFGPGFDPKSLAAALDVETLAAPGMRLRRGHTDLRREADRLVVAATADGGAWRLDRLTAALPGVFGAAPSDQAAAVEWEGHGRLPDAILAFLRSYGVDFAELGEVSMTGRAAADAATVRAVREVPDVSIDPLRVTVQPGRVGLPGGIALDRVSGDLRLIGGLNAQGMRLVAEPGSSVAVEAAGMPNVRLVRADPGGMPVVLPIESRATQAWFEFASGRGGFRLRLDADRDVHLALGESATAAIQGLAGSCEGQFEPDAGRVTVAVQTDSLVLADPGGMSVDAGATDSTVVYTSDSSSARLEVAVTPGLLALRDRAGKEVVRFGRETLGPVALDYDLAGERGFVRFTWPLRPEAVLAGTGTLDLRGPEPAVDVALVFNDIRLTEDDDAVKRLAAATDMTVTGTVSLDGRVRLAHGRLEPRVTATVKNAVLANQKFQLKAEGINGAVTVIGLDPPASPGDQRFTVRSATVGELQLRDGLVAFRLEADPRAIFIERTEWGWAGGRLYNNALRIDPTKEYVSLRVFADGLKMQDVFRLIFGEKVEADGTMYGMVPVTFAPSRPEQIVFGQGFLYATPGGGWWDIRSTPAGPGEGAVSGALDAVRQALVRGAQTREQQQQRQRVYDGLLNYRYTVFKLDLIEQGDGLLARVTTTGESRDPKNPLEYEGLTVDFPNFEKPLRRVLFMKRVYERTLEEKGSQMGEAVPQ